MQAKRISSLGLFFGLLASAMGCTNMQHVGDAMGFGPPVPPKVEKAFASAPLPNLREMHGTPVEHSHLGTLPSPPGYAVEPSCYAPEPSCGIGSPSCTSYEPTCASPTNPPGYGPRASHSHQGPCGHSQCRTCASGTGPRPEETHQHVVDQAEKGPQGCLAFGGGHMTIPLPTLQFPGFFRVPAVRTAVLPVAEPLIVETPVAETAIAAVQPVAAVQQVAFAPSAGVVQEIPVRLVPERTADFAPSSGGANEKLGCICDEELEKLLPLIKEAIEARKRAGQPADLAPSSGTPTPADATAEIEELRTLVRDYQEDIDKLILELNSNRPAPGP